MTKLADAMSHGRYDRSPVRASDNYLIRGHSVGRYLNNAKLEHSANFERSHSAIQASSSSSVLASLRSAVSNPSVNQP
jgi:hypothetical protein